MNKKIKEIKLYLSSLLRVSFILLAALLLPRLYISEKRGTAIALSRSFSTSPRFKLGIENLTPEYLSTLIPQTNKDYQVGLITNQYAIDQSGRRTIDLLKEKGLPIKRILIPKHEYGNNQKREANQMIDLKTKIPICYLPKKNKENADACALFNDLDLIFLDIQDNGISSARLITTLLAGMQLASECKKKLVILDRPNPLGGNLEGALLSYMDSVCLPVRHGLTVAELALYCNQFLSNPVSLTIVPMSNYDRTLLSDHYSTFSGLKMNIDIQCNYAKGNYLNEFWPFETINQNNLAMACLALPQECSLSSTKWCQLQALLKRSGVQTSLINYYKNRTRFSGLQLMIKNPDSFSSFTTLISILQFFKENKIAYNLENKKFASPKIEEFLDGKCTRADLQNEINKDLKKFLNKAHHVLIYKPEPTIVMF